MKARRPLIDNGQLTMDNRQLTLSRPRTPHSRLETGEGIHSVNSQACLAMFTAYNQRQTGIFEKLDIGLDTNVVLEIVPAGQSMGRLLNL